MRVDLLAPLDLSHSWKAFPYTKIQEESSHVSFSSSCLVSVATSKPLVYLELVVVCGVNYEADFVFFQMSCPLSCLFMNPSLPPVIGDATSPFTKFPCAFCSYFYKRSLFKPSPCCIDSINFSSRTISGCSLPTERLLSCRFPPSKKRVYYCSSHLLSTYCELGIMLSPERSLSHLSRQRLRKRQNCVIPTVSAQGHS